MMKYTINSHRIERSYAFPFLSFLLMVRHFEYFQPKTWSQGSSPLEKLQGHVLSWLERLSGSVWPSAGKSRSLISLKLRRRMTFENLLWQACFHRAREAVRRWYPQAISFGKWIFWVKLDEQLFRKILGNKYNRALEKAGSHHIKLNFKKFVLL